MDVARRSRRPTHRSSDCGATVYLIMKLFRWVMCWFDKLVLASWLMARSSNAKAVARLGELRAYTQDDRRDDARASLPVDTLRRAYEEELSYRSEIVAKTHQLVNAVSLVATLVSVGAVAISSLFGTNNVYWLIVAAVLSVVFFYFLLAWRMILVATAPAEVSQYSIEDAITESEEVGLITSIDYNRQVTYQILNRSEVARNSVWRALIVASFALVAAALANCVGPIGGSDHGSGEQPAIERGIDDGTDNDQAIDDNR